MEREAHCGDSDGAKKFENEPKEKRYECERKPRKIFMCYTRFSQTKIVDQSVSRILSHDDISTSPYWLGCPGF